MKPSAPPVTPLVIPQRLPVAKAVRVDNKHPRCDYGRCVSANCPRYEGWGCLLPSIILGFIGFVLLIGFMGPWYNDCDHNDCSSQRTSGIYCEDYCVYGNYGPGSLLVAFCLAGILLVIAFPYCCVDDGRHKRRDFYGEDPNYYVGKPKNISTSEMPMVSIFN